MLARRKPKKSEHSLTFQKFKNLNSTKYPKDGYKASYALLKKISIFKTQKYDGKKLPEIINW